MNTKQFILNTVGCFDSDIDKIESIKANFNVDITTDVEMHELIRDSLPYQRLGDAIIARLYEKVIDKSVRELGIGEMNFSTEVNGCCSYLYYKGEVVSDWSQIERASNEN